MVNNVNVAGKLVVLEEFGRREDLLLAGIPRIVAVDDLAFLLAQELRDGVQADPFQLDHLFQGPRKFRGFLVRIRERLPRGRVFGVLAKIAEKRRLTQGLAA